MTLEFLPLSLQHSLLLEWLSPECVWKAVRASGVLRRAALSLPSAISSFWAAEGEVLSDACIRWFRKHDVTLVLWTEVKTDLWWVRYFCNGVCHRDGDQPAIVHADGTLDWYQHGKLHRDGDMPAVMTADGVRRWYRHGELHRDGDRPAVMTADGVRRWYRHGELHRDGNQPAVVRHISGSQVDLEWWRHGRRYHTSS